MSHTLRWCPECFDQLKGLEWQLCRNQWWKRALRQGRETWRLHGIKTRWPKNTTNHIESPNHTIIEANMVSYCKNHFNFPSMCQLYLQPHRHYVPPSNIARPPPPPDLAGGAFEEPPPPPKVRWACWAIWTQKMMEPTRSGWGVGDETVSNFSKPLGWKMPISFDDFANQFLFGFGRGLQLLKVSYMLGVICQTMWSFDTMARCWPRTLKFPYHGSLCDELRGQLGSSNSYHWTLLEYFLPHSCRKLVAIATGSFPSVQKSPTRVEVTSAVRG